MRIIHVSDIHFWNFTRNPARLFNKRLLGVVSLSAGRARRFRLEHVPELVSRVHGLDPDHLLITGDLTTTALESEFRAATRGLATWLTNPERVTIIPGNHDRYTLGAHLGRNFERHFGDYAPQRHYPWLRYLDPETAILGLDPTRSAVSARGKLPAQQLDRARELIDRAGHIKRLVVACHYPVIPPIEYAAEYHAKRLVNATAVGEWLTTIGPHLLCCGHVHAAWADEPAGIAGQLCLNAGAPLLRPGHGHSRRMPGFLEIELEGTNVSVFHHGWNGIEWRREPLRRVLDFFRR